MTNDDWTKRQVRQDVQLEADIHLPGVGTERVMLGNLSDEGCCIEGVYAIGDRIELTIPQKGRVRGQVRWSIGGRAGIRFLPEEPEGGGPA